MWHRIGVLDMAMDLARRLFSCLEPRKVIAVVWLMAWKNSTSLSLLKLRDNCSMTGLVLGILVSQSLKPGR